LFEVQVTLNVIVQLIYLVGERLWNIYEQDEWVSYELSYLKNIIRLVKINL